MPERDLLTLLASYGSDIDRLKRRLSRMGGAFTLPDRLGPLGQGVLDWNTDASLPGFYWSDNTAVNGPVADRLMGTTWVISGGSLAGRIIQEVMLPSASASVLRTWRRIYSGTSWTAWYPSGWQPTNYFVYRSSAQSIPNAAWTPISWNANTLNEGSIGFSGGVFTIPVKGTYLINAMVHYATLAATSVGQRTLGITHNATRIEGLAYTAFPANIAAGAQITLVRSCDVGDTISVDAYQSQGAAQNTLAGDAYTWAQISLQNPRA